MVCMREQFRLFFCMMQSLNNECLGLLLIRGSRYELFNSYRVFGTEKQIY